MTAILEQRIIGSAMRCILCGLIAFVLAAVAEAATPGRDRSTLILGENLMPSGSFATNERGALKNWQMDDNGAGHPRFGWTNQTGVDGRGSLVGTFDPKAESSSKEYQLVVLNGPSIKVVPGQWYTLSCWTRWTVAGNQRGPDMQYWIYWQTADGRWTRSEGAVENEVGVCQDFRPVQVWRRSPRGAACAQVRLEFYVRRDLPTTTVYWSNWQLRRVAVGVEPGVEKKYAFPGWLDSVNARCIKDPSSRHGEILETDPSQYRAGFLHSGPLRTFGSPGLYEVTFRIRQVQAAPVHQTAITLVVGNANNLVYGMGARDILPEDFPDNANYHEFTLLLPRYPGIAFNFGADWKGAGVYRIEEIRLEKLHAFTDEDAFRLLYDGVRDDVSASSTADSAEAYVINGLYTDLYGVYPALEKLRLQWKRSYVSGDVQNAIRPAFSNVPLGKTRLMVWCNACATMFNVKQRRAIQRFVAEGGGLFVCGDYYSYGNAALKDTYLETLLPVVVRGPWGLRRTSNLEAGSPIVTVQKPGQPFGDAKVNGTENARGFGSVQWIHKVGLKEGAEVVLTAGERPFLVRGHYGKGRIACLLGTVLGQPSDPFWQTTKYQKTVENTCRWLVGQEKEVCFP